jgi:EAL domain-containing protein (putative c-di-GMP-specific phosphodiesterase class I)/GGDEF domain-containing protein
MSSSSSAQTSNFFSAIAIAGASGGVALVGFSAALAAAEIRGSAVDGWVFVIAGLSVLAVALSAWLVARGLSQSAAQGDAVPVAAAPAQAAPIDPMALFEDRLGMALARAGRNGGSVTALAISADQFEECRSGLGEAVAEALEHEVFSRVARVVRADEMVLRVAQNRLMAVIVHADEEALAAMVGRIRSQFDAILPVGGERMAITLSIGVAHDGNGIAPAGGLIRSAEVALAEARGEGGDRVVNYRHELDDIAHARVMIARDFRDALGRGDEVALVFQPIWSLETGAMTGAEALLRWNHAIHGRLSAPFLVSLAEDSGLLDRMSHWAFEAGFAPIETAGLPLAGFNLSIGQIESDTIIDHLCELAGSRRNGHPRLSIDFPPLAIDRETTAGALGRLHEAGIALCLDGLGDTPLATARKLTVWSAETGVRVDKIKIDLRGFPALSQSPDDKAQLFNIAVHMRSAGISVAAKTVETSDQLAQLAPLGITEVQGNRLCAPVTGTTLIRLASEPSPLYLAQNE